jgi:hypothetical protein
LSCVVVAVADFLLTFGAPYRPGGEELRLVLVNASEPPRHFQVFVDGDRRRIVACLGVTGSPATGDPAIR